MLRFEGELFKNIIAKLLLYSVKPLLSEIHLEGGINNQEIPRITFLKYFNFAAI